MSFENPFMNGSEAGSEKESSTMMRLNQNPTIQRQLGMKMEEYQRRCDAAAAQGRRDMDSVYKYLILEELLTNGFIDVSEFYERNLLTRQPQDVQDNFWNAVNVIGQYNKGTTSRLQGGTGF